MGDLGSDAQLAFGPRTALRGSDPTRPRSFPSSRLLKPSKLIVSA
jgi:hypothetical protein